jgi:hypothetical protein
MPNQPAVLFVNVGSVFPLKWLAMALRHRDHVSPITLIRTTSTYRRMRSRP